VRCPDCNKFVAYDTEVDPEESHSPEVDGNLFSASFRRVLACEQCGTELKEAEVEFSYDFTDKVNEHEEVEGEPKPEEHTEHEWEIDACDASPATDVKKIDRNGKPIRLARYMTTLYGVDVHVECSCAVDNCKATAEFDVSEFVAASSMDEMV